MTRQIPIRENIVKFCRNFNKDLKIEFEVNGIQNLINITFPTCGKDEIPSLLTLDLALRHIVLFTDSDEEKKLAFVLGQYFELGIMH